MSKYIDTDKVIAFLNKKMESYKSKMVDPYKYPVDHIDLMALLAREYQSLILRVASFQQEQPEVDLEKEVSKWWDTFFPEPDFKFRKHRAHIVTNDEIIELARHFYELGKNSK